MSQKIDWAPLGLIYLASPYSHSDPEIQQQRHDIVAFQAGQIIKQGGVVFCPIAMSKAINELNACPGSFDFWKNIDLPILNRCDTLVVCTIDGWKESVGVTAEIEYAREKKQSVFLYNGKTLERI